MKSDAQVLTRLTDVEEGMFEASRAALNCSRATLAREGIKLVGEAALAAMADGVSVKSIDELRAFLAEKLRPNKELA